MVESSGSGAHEVTRMSQNMWDISSAKMEETVLQSSEKDDRSIKRLGAFRRLKVPAVDYISRQSVDISRRKNPKRPYLHRSACPQTVDRTKVSNSARPE